jgi:ElaB/YqjD/DUF883 family membrane-anchored ribosome-binding protein
MSDEAGAEQIRTDIEQTRAELADTVDALSDKLNVKARAGDKAGEAKAKVSSAAAQAKAKAPEPVQHALETVGAKARPVAHQASEQIRPYRKQILIGVSAAMAVLLILRRKRNA